MRAQRSGYMRHNPWHATGLEWHTSSPPPQENFEVIPRVSAAPYDDQPSSIGPEPLQPQEPP